MQKGNPGAHRQNNLGDGSPLIRPRRRSAENLNALDRALQ